MDTITIVLISGLLWYACGVASFIFWWTKEFELTTDDLIFALFIGFFGPIAFGMGWTVHGDDTVKDRVIKKRRDND